ncbi:MAG TPA: SprT-like domain-containing protein [Chitinophagaceae bacterium]|nr:SprT-like domain-containing protein [Chitinophagaceae bacterium]
MPKKEAPFSTLQTYLPDGALPLVLEYIYLYKVHLTITRERRSVLGDYRHAVNGKNHRISVNGSLNRYAFLITLIHEIAHLVTFLEYGNKVASHGKEWKMVYRRLLEKFLEGELFPADIKAALQKSLHDLPASSCADEGLMRILKRYDSGPQGLLVEQLPADALFLADDGRMFKKGKQLRKRFQCLEVSTGKLYLFSPVYEVTPYANGQTPG